MSQVTCIDGYFPQNVQYLNRGNASPTDDSGNAFADSLPFDLLMRWFWRVREWKFEVTVNLNQRFRYSEDKYVDVTYNGTLTITDVANSGYPISDEFDLMTFVGPFPGVAIVAVTSDEVVVTPTGAFTDDHHIGSGSIFFNGEMICAGFTPPDDSNVCGVVSFTARVFLTLELYNQDGGFIDDGYYRDLAFPASVGGIFGEPDTDRPTTEDSMEVEGASRDLFGNPESFDNPAANTSGSLAVSGIKFTPTKFWGYDDTYDTTTGLEL